MYVMHNKAHEYYVFCRDVQKHGVSSKCGILLQHLRNGKCTADLSRTFNGGYPMKLGDAFKHVVADCEDDLKAHKAGDDAMMCALIYFEHADLRVKKNNVEEIDRCAKRARHG